MLQFLKILSHWIDDEIWKLLDSMGYLLNLPEEHAFSARGRVGKFTRTS